MSSNIDPIARLEKLKATAADVKRERELTTKIADTILLSQGYKDFQITLIRAGKTDDDQLYVVTLYAQSILRAISKDVIPRATVAEALAALRIEWTHQKAHYDNSQDDIFWERGQELETRLRELDATIAKLGLAESRPRGRGVMEQVFLMEWADRITPTRAGSDGIGTTIDAGGLNHAHAGGE